MDLIKSFSLKAIVAGGLVLALCFVVLCAGVMLILALNMPPGPVDPAKLRSLWTAGEENRVYGLVMAYSAFMVAVAGVTGGYVIGRVAKRAEIRNAALIPCVMVMITFVSGLVPGITDDADIAQTVAEDVLVVWIFMAGGYAAQRRRLKREQKERRTRGT